MSSPTTTEILAYLENFITPERKEKIHQILSQRTQHFTVVIEDVFQMHNASAVVRSCDIFGIQDLHAITVKNALKTDTEIAMGAQKWVDLYRYTTKTTCIKNLKAKGYQIVVTTPHEGACLLQDFDITPPTALIFGTEKLGVSSEIMKMANASLKIPMVGFTESLNISVSVAIILQELGTRLRKSSINWKLPPTVFLEKKLDWTMKSTRSVKDILKHYHENYPL